MIFSGRGDFVAVFQRSVAADKDLAKAFGNNWRKNNPSKDIRLVDFQMENINAEVGCFFLYKQDLSKLK